MNPALFYFDSIAPNGPQGQILVKKEEKKEEKRRRKTEFLDPKGLKE